jgi:hypothetical protein
MVSFFTKIHEVDMSFKKEAKKFLNKVKENLPETAQKFFDDHGLYQDAFHAIKENKSDEYQDLINKGVNPCEVPVTLFYSDITTDRNTLGTPFVYSAAKDKPEALKISIEAALKNNFLNCPPENQEDALHLAIVKHKNLKMVEMLTESNIPYGDGYDFLEDCTKIPYSDNTKAIFEKVVSKFQHNVNPEGEKNLALIAAEKGNFAMMKLFLQHGVCPTEAAEYLESSHSNFYIDSACNHTSTDTVYGKFNHGSDVEYVCLMGQDQLKVEMLASEAIVS